MREIVASINPLGCFFPKKCEAKSVQNIDTFFAPFLLWGRCAFHCRAIQMYVFDPFNSGFSMALHCRNNLGMAVVAACRCGHGRAGAKALREAGCTVLEEFDVTSDDCGPRAAAAAREAVGEDGELWCLVNNAAVLVFAEAEWQTPRQIDLQMKANPISSRPNCRSDYLSAP